MSEYEKYIKESIPISLSSTPSFTVPAVLVKAIEPLPKPVGYWKIDPSHMGYRISMFTKPTDDVIENHGKLLGWQWVDNNL